jgi:hypothetical protein
MTTKADKTVSYGSGPRSELLFLLGIVQRENRRVALALTRPNLAPTTRADLEEKRDRLWGILEDLHIARIASK